MPKEVRLTIWLVLLFVIISAFLFWIFYPPLKKKIMKKNVKKFFYKRVIKAANAFGILFSAHSYDVNSSVSAEKLHEIGFTYVRISHQTLQNAMASQSANTSFIRMAAELDEKKLVPIVNRVTDQDQAQFCLDLAMPYYVDGEKGNDLTEQEFITYLNYKK